MVSFSELGLDASPATKSPARLEGDAADGSFASKHGRHVVGHIDDYSALRQQIGEGELLVRKMVSVVRSACHCPGLDARGTEVITSPHSASPSSCRRILHLHPAGLFPRLLCSL